MDIPILGAATTKRSSSIAGGPVEVLATSTISTEGYGSFDKWNDATNECERVEWVISLGYAMALLRTQLSAQTSSGSWTREVAGWLYLVEHNVPCSKIGNAEGVE